jgi:ATP-dependent DNA ligase
LYYSFVPKQSFPDWVQPMAATLTQERFTDPEWSFERKFDGIRLLAYKKGRKVELFSRNHLPQNIPAISQAIAKLPHRELILDGEITWHAPFSYHIFDIMWIDGRETMSLPLEERRALLKQLPLTAPLKRVTELNVSVPGADRGPRAGGPRGVVDATGSKDNSAVNQEAPWELAQREGWEGVIAKRRGSVYEQRRSRNWLKMKCELAQEFVVGGFTDPQGKRVGLGALLVGYYEYASEPNSPSPSGRGRVRVRSLTGGSLSSHARGSDAGAQHIRGSSPTVREGSAAQSDFVFAGKIGTGFDTKMLLDLRAQLDQIEIEKPPFTKAVGLPRLRAHWVQPQIVVQVGFIQWTGHGKLRHPRLLGVRNDKDPREVVRD